MSRFRYPEVVKRVWETSDTSGPQKAGNLPPPWEHMNDIILGDSRTSSRSFSHHCIFATEWNLAWEYFFLTAMRLLLSTVSKSAHISLAQPLIKVSV